MKYIIYTRMMLAGFLLILSSFAYAQDAKFAGRWEGTLNVGIELRLVFNITAKPGGGLTATADSPDQSAYGIPCDSAVAKGNTLTITMTRIQAGFTGELINDSTINGTFKQLSSTPLVLKKTAKSVARNRPQLPSEPFPYQAIEVNYNNAKDGIQLAGTLTIPPSNDKKQKFPAIILITGSGPQDRDESLMGHKPFAVLADYLTRNGYAVLRVDDRGTGKSSGDFAKATSLDFAVDVEAGIDFLKARKDIDDKKIGLLGHSEGGMIAPIVARKRKDVDFIVLLAAPGIKITELMIEQNEAILKSVNLSAAAIESYKPLYRDLMQTIIAATDTLTAYNKSRELFEKWVNKTPASIQEELGMKEKESREAILQTLVNTFSNSWFRFFLGFDPNPYLEKLDCKVLALNGDRDIQVISSSNLAGIEAALKKGGNKTYELHSLKGLNHLFQECKKCTIEEYGELEQTFSPSALSLITQWLNKNVNRPQ